MLLLVCCLVSINSSYGNCCHNIRQIFETQKQKFQNENIQGIEEDIIQNSEGKEGYESFMKQELKGFENDGIYGKNELLSQEAKDFMEKIKSLNNGYADKSIFYTYDYWGGTPNPLNFNTFEDIKTSFLEKINKSDSFYFKESEKVADTGGPSRKLLSVFYDNLKKNYSEKLKITNAWGELFMNFGKDLTPENCEVLGELAFFSLIKSAHIEYNFPDIYYKIMLYPDDKNLEDFLTLGDFKKALAIFRNAGEFDYIFLPIKEGLEFYDTNLDNYIQIFIKPDNSKDKVLLRDCKEEIYENYYKKLFDKSDKSKDVDKSDKSKDADKSDKSKDADKSDKSKDADKSQRMKGYNDFCKDSETEICKMLFGAGEKIKQQIASFKKGFDKRFREFLSNYSLSTISFIGCFNSVSQVARDISFLFKTEKILIDNKEISVECLPKENLLWYVNSEEDKESILENEFYKDIYTSNNFVGNPRKINNFAELKAYWEKNKDTFEKQDGYWEINNAIEKFDEKKETPSFWQLCREFKLRPQDLKELIQGIQKIDLKTVLSLLSVSNYSDDYFSVEDIKTIMGKKIAEKNEAEKVEYLKNFLKCLTCCSVPNGKIQINCYDKYPETDSKGKPLQAQGHVMHTCSKQLDLYKNNDKSFKDVFERFLNLDVERGYNSVFNDL